MFPPLLDVGCSPFFFAGGQRHGFLFCQLLDHPLLGPTKLVIHLDLHKLDSLSPFVYFAQHPLKGFLIDEGAFWSNSCAGTSARCCVAE